MRKAAIVSIAKTSSQDRNTDAKDRADWLAQHENFVALNAAKALFDTHQ
jgi:hypothetical protein